VTRWYLALMGTCLTLYALAGFVVRLYSTPAAVVMAAVATFIPPVAAIVANAGREGGRGSNDPNPPTGER
jgi:Protein of unknown function (DUF3099)